MHATAATARITEPAPPPQALPAGASERPWRRSFWSLIATQFQGAFSDNILKNLVLFFVLGLGLPAAERDLLVPLATFLFALPFILFSMAGGFLADRHSKRAVTAGTKLMEIGVMFFALAGLAQRNLVLQMTAIFLLSTQAALFGPSKYGLLPELLPEKRLSWGNGILELGTFLAIITGTVTGALLFEQFRQQPAISGAILIALSCLGLFLSLGIERVPAAAPDKAFRLNFLRDVWEQLRVIRRDRVLALAVVGNTYFWFLGALLISTVLVYGTDFLHAAPRQNSYLQACVAIGIGLGSIAAGYLSANKIEYGLIPLGSLGITAFGFALGAAAPSFATAAALLALLGFSSGFFAVPVNALLQHRPHADEKGGVIAAANLLSFVGVALAAGVYWVLTVKMHLPATGVFLATATITLAGTAYVLVLLPDALLRLVLWLLTHSLYSIRVVGRDNIPDKGGALFVCNHLSFVDALLLIASTDRPIRFLVYQGIYDLPVVKPLARIARCIPISSQQRPRDLLHSLRVAQEAVRAGEVVCIFAEGQITRTGQLLPFRRGFERIMQGVDAPILPVALDGVWGSIFSFERHRFLWKLPRRIPYPVTVFFGAPMPATSTATEVRQAVQQLQSESFAWRRARMHPLDRALVRSAHSHPRRFAMADARSGKLTYASVLRKTIFLARRLAPVWQDQRMVGVLLPPSPAAAMVNYAATLAGKVPVNLNYTASDTLLASCAQQCGLQTVITSKAFLERLPTLHVPEQVCFIEDIAATPRLAEKAAAWLGALLPYRLLKRLLHAPTAKLDDLATVIFSSGSTGDPKGVMLSHFNIAANISQMAQVFMLGRHDRVLGILPFFHSFGFTATLWMPLHIGSGTVFHPSPLDARSISALVAAYRVTLLIATPTFLQAYIRRCSPEDFGSLQYVLVGAEKLPERTRQAFEERFGIRPLEGYGCTECAPVVSVNTRDFRAPGFRQVGARTGTIGHPLPGISVRVVDPATFAPLPFGQPGMLLVRGPNVMQGYLGRPEKTAEVLRDGWYVTGDIAAIDEDGFITITDRLSRFSKIGGEMVPHVKVEETLQALTDTPEQVLAVAAVADEKKGERLVVLHTLADDKLASLLEQLPQAALPPLWKPRPNDFVHIDALPYLGTGKLDLQKLKQLAAASAAAR